MALSKAWSATSPSPLSSDSIHDVTQQFNVRLLNGAHKLKLATEGITTVSWDVLSRQFLDQYIARLSGDSPMPQLDHASTTVADRHYIEPNDDQFDEALHWLGKHLGIDLPCQTAS
jgi:hypothetical protein